MVKVIEEKYHLVADKRELLIVRHIFQSKHEEKKLRLKHNICHPRCMVKRNMWSNIIDGGTCDNIMEPRG